ncbi:phosphatidylinositol 3 [Corchorus capsularis]|uniref:Phosphatidylinositol 3 n=1 Tax=Corchorus capsularis TaxID=210143 RepID=A0A1R3GV82_COCAP|nr:phosphatidylinositol 3 [Corchorus capsularis]
MEMKLPQSKCHSYRHLSSITIPSLRPSPPPSARIFHSPRGPSPSEFNGGGRNENRNTSCLQGGLSKGATCHAYGKDLATSKVS